MLQRIGTNPDFYDVTTGPPGDWVGISVVYEIDKKEVEIAWGARRGLTILAGGGFGPFKDDSKRAFDTRLHYGAGSGGIGFAEIRSTR